MLFLLPHSDNVPLTVADALHLVYHSKPMALLGTVLGFSAFGLASRFGQLAIQKRNLMDSMLLSTDIQHSYIWLSDLAGHAIAIAAFGYAGYWVHHYEVRTNELIAWKRAEIQARADAEREARAASAA